MSFCAEQLSTSREIATGLPAFKDTLLKTNVMAFIDLPALPT
jgi:hypothetical protein